MLGFRFQQLATVSRFGRAISMKSPHDDEGVVAMVGLSVAESGDLIEVALPNLKIDKWLNAIGNRKIVNRKW